MINWDNVLNYVKGRLSLPSTFIEKTDKEMKDWIINVTIPDFSNYYPDVEYASVIAGSSNHTIPGKTNWYRFFDDEDLPIYGIKECYFDIGDDYITGHPPVGVFSFDNLGCWALDVFKSRFFKPFSYWYKTYKFIPPNQVRVLPDAQGQNFVVEYERQQPEDLRRIPAGMKRLFMDLCYADVGLWIASIRSHYGDGRISTPFGEIPLSAQSLQSECNDLRREVLEKLIDDTIPPIIIDIG